MSHFGRCCLLVLLLGATPLVGCRVTAPAPVVTVGWWYYPYYDVYYRDGLWWYFGVDGWILVETLPPAIVIPPDAARVRVNLPEREAPHTRWPEHRVHRSGSAAPSPRTWSPTAPPRTTHPPAGERRSTTPKSGRARP